MWKSVTYLHWAMSPESEYKVIVYEKEKDCQMVKLNISRENKFKVFFCDFDEAQNCWDWCRVAVCEVEGWEKAGDVERDFFVVLIFEGGDPGGEFPHFLFAVVFVRDN